MSNKSPNYCWPVLEPFAGYMDGDTVDMVIDRGFHDRSLMRFRLLGINAPERYTEEGKKATTALHAFMDAGKPLTVMSVKMGDFRRWLGVIYDKDGNSINDKMIEYGYAVPYSR